METSPKVAIVIPKHYGVVSRNHDRIHFPLFLLLMDLQSPWRRGVLYCSGYWDAWLADVVPAHKSPEKVARHSFNPWFPTRSQSVGLVSSDCREHGKEVARSHLFGMLLPSKLWWSAGKLLRWYLPADVARNKRQSCLLYSPLFSSPESIQKVSKMKKIWKNNERTLKDSRSSGA